MNVPATLQGTIEENAAPAPDSVFVITCMGIFIFLYKGLNVSPGSTTVRYCSPIRIPVSIHPTELNITSAV